MTPDVPDELATREQWICWRNECRDCGLVLDPQEKVCDDCDEKATKRPINPTDGSFARVDDEETWATREEAEAYHDQSDTHGLGFVFTEDDPIAGVDLDGCVDPETGEIDDWAADIVTTLSTYTEYSPSGTGLHALCYGEVPDGGTRKDGVEMYDSERYFTVTGDRLPRSPSNLNYREDEIEAVHSGYINTGSAGGSDVVDYSLDVPKDVDEEEFETELGRSLTEIRDQDEKLDLLLTEEKAGYESTSEADMAAVSKLWFWRFTRDDIAKILRVYRRRPKVIERDDYLELTIGKAATGEQYDPRPTEHDDVEILDDRTRVDSIDEVEFPDRDHFVLDKPPREGGSHASIDNLSDENLIVLASRHTICDHHLDILEKTMPDGKTAVHLTGSGRACRSDSGNCDKIVGAENISQLFQLEHEAMDAVHSNRVVTADDCPEEYCPAQFIKYAAEHAHAVVTVPQLLADLSDRDLVSGSNLLIDEEQALSYFRPASVDLVDIEQVFEPDGSRQIQVSSSSLGDQVDTVRDIYEKIIDERYDDDEEPGSKRRSSVEKHVEDALEYLEQVRDTLSISDIVDELASQEGGMPSAKDVVDEIRDRLESIDRPDATISPGKLRRKLEEYVNSYYFDDSVDPRSYIETVYFRYDDRPFDVKKAGGSYTIRMIGGRDVFHKQELLSARQIGIIAGPEGELLLDDLGLDAKTIVIESFRYADDFAVIPVGAERDGEMESPKRQRERAARVSAILNKKSHSHIAITGTKEQAKSHHARLDQGLTDIISNPVSPAMDIYATWTAGGTAVIYENSAVSRGIDAPVFDISVVASSGFATPYWEARMAHYRGEDDEEYEYAAAVESQLKSHELTNAVLRQAPTRHTDDICGTKFIVLADWDVPRLRYLQDSVLPRFAKAESVANTLENLTINGAFREEIEDVYWAHDQHEGAFTETVMRSPLKEEELARPAYEKGELETWINNRYFSVDSAVEQVERAVPPRSEVETSYVLGLFQDWAEGRVGKALEVLRRMDVLEMDKKDDGSRGEPTRVWSKSDFKSEDG